MKLAPRILLLSALLSARELPAQAIYSTPYVVSTLAGQPTTNGSADGTGNNAQFFQAEGVAVDASGNVFVADSQNNEIRKITPAGVVTTLAGQSGTLGSTDATGSAARFRTPTALVVDGSGNIYVADTVNNTIRKVTPTGDVTTIAGTALTTGSTDGTGANARFDAPRGITIDGLGNLYVADSNNTTIRKITPGAVVTTVAGTPGVGGTADGTGSAARFGGPRGLAVDNAGNIYVADTFIHTIRKVTPAGVVTTVAGTGGSQGYVDGTGSSVRFRYPRALTVDAGGNIFVADTNNLAIRKITPAGAVSTVAGRGVFSGYADLAGSSASFSLVGGIAIDGAGQLYIADAISNSLIRKAVLVVTNDFNSDGHSDIVWQNATTGDRGFWLMNSTTFSSWVDLGLVATDWHIAATADFNADGKTDIVWENAVTGDRYVWLMNGTVYGAGVSLGSISTDWRIAAAADFNGDGKPDILWENTVTGNRVIWFMDGTALTSTLSLGVVSTDYHIVAAADFNADAKPDILFENNVTGDRYLWLMNGAAYSSGLDLGVVATDWHIAAAADYNGDGKTDILWENTVTGDRGVWLMNGTTFSSWVDIGMVSTDWRIAN